MPLDALISHIKKLKVGMHELKRELEEIPFPRIKSSLAEAIQNYANGLNIIEEGLKRSVVERARIISKMEPKSGRPLSVEQVIYRYYQETIRTSYLMAERFNTQATMLVRGKIPPELYLWLHEIADHFEIDKTIVLQEGERFLTETFDDRIVEPLRFMIDLAKKQQVVGTIDHVEPMDLLQSSPIEDGYIVSCVRGEADNPILWPILCHEMFESIDKEKSLLDEFRKHVSQKSKELPVLSADPKMNEHWILEIFMDFLAINSFGPMYAKSLLEYFRRSPYYQTFEHPEMSSRLFCVYLFLKESFMAETDIFDKCQHRAKQEVKLEIERYESLNELHPEKEKALSSLYSLMSEFLDELRIPSFFERLKKHKERSLKSETKFDDVYKDDEPFIAFQGPLLEFNDIRDNILHHHISLAIDPNIMLNVVIADFDKYGRDHLRVVIDSIRKWKIKQVWNHSVDKIRIGS